MIPLARPARALFLAVGVVALLLGGPAPARAQGAATIAITGLEQAVETLRPRQGQQTTKAQADLVTALSILSLVGKQEGAARTYRLETTADGKLLVNGTDIGPLIRMYETQTGGQRR